jgi:hypothetical protein
MLTADYADIADGDKGYTFINSIIRVIRVIRGLILRSPFGNFLFGNSIIVSDFDIRIFSAVLPVEKAPHNRLVPDKNVSTGRDPWKSGVTIGGPTPCPTEC